jgi:hypothetical protein
MSILSSIDWELLRTQKEWLLNNGSDEAMGIAHLLDFIQDSVVMDGIATEQQVFGDDHE